MQKARGHTVQNIVLPLLVGWRFQFLFHSPPGVLFTFPSRYSSTIGHRVVFSLGRWSSQIPTRFHVPRGTQELSRVQIYFVYGTITLCGQPFHTLPLYSFLPISRSYNPGYFRFGLLRVRSPLLAESRLISTPADT